ncbi:MAG: acyltransferase family protein [Theionarchaea archaeon]|nr:acyltransferase family protein [Theionarchaea archaeon]
MLYQQRLFALDNVRVFLILIVVAFHASAPYAEVPWYTIPPETTPLTSVLLSWFLAVCAAFMLSLFFMISGYFTPFSYYRKGSTLFWKDRLMRLGIPLVVFFFGVMPLFTYLLCSIDGTVSPFWDFLSSEYHWETHHLWFLNNLLLFTGGYWIYHVSRFKPIKRLNNPGNSTILLFVIFIALATFLVRIWYPIGEWDALKLVEPSYLPQFGGLFIAGILAYHHQWFKKVSTSVGLTWLKIGFVTALLFPLIYLVGEGSYEVLRGGFSWQPFVFSVWESFICVGFCVGLPILFREKAATEKIGILAASTYAVYLIHLPVVVSIQRALVGVGMHPLIKVLIAITGGLCLSFVISHFLRKLPFVKKIL